MPIVGSVGAGGNNKKKDVVYVQCLLSDWLMRRNIEPIDIDGIFGPETADAILKFQKAMAPISDGRIDVGGPTVRALEQAHLDGLMSGRWLGIAAKYGRPVPRDPAVLRLLYDAYLLALYNGYKTDENSIC